MQHGLADQYFKIYEKILKNGSMNGLFRRNFLYRRIYLLSKKWEKVIASRKYFE